MLATGDAILHAYGAGFNAAHNPRTGATSNLQLAAEFAEVTNRQAGSRPDAGKSGVPLKFRGPARVDRPLWPETLREGPQTLVLSSHVLCLPARVASLAHAAKSSGRRASRLHASSPSGLHGRGIVAHTDLFPRVKC